MKYSFTPRQQRRRKGAMITENEIAKKVVDLCFKIHTMYGPDLFESVYGEFSVMSGIKIC